MYQKRIFCRKSKTAISIIHKRNGDDIMVSRAQKIINPGDLIFKSILEALHSEKKE